MWAQARSPIVESDQPTTQKPRESQAKALGITPLLAVEFGDSYPLSERIFREKAGMVADEILRLVHKQS